MNHVLVTDHDLETCKEIKYSLQDDTTDVYCTHSVDEAIHMLKKKIYTLVILDICLSQEAGTALIQQIRQMNSRAQALMRRYTQLNHITERGYALVSHGNLLLDTARRQVLVGEERRIPL